MAKLITASLGHKDTLNIFGGGIMYKEITEYSTTSRCNRRILTRGDSRESITRREKGNGSSGCTRVTGRERRGKRRKLECIRDNKQTKGEECHREPRWTINKERAERLRSQRYTKVHGNSQKLAESCRNYFIAPNRNANYQKPTMRIQIAVPLHPQLANLATEKG